MTCLLILGEEIQKTVTFVKKPNVEENEDPRNEDKEGLKLSQMHSNIDRREAMFALKLSCKVKIFLISMGNLECTI